MQNNQTYKKFFAHGGMSKNQKNTKLHISDVDGNILCNVKSFWMQQYGELNKDGLLPDNLHVIKNHKEQNTCKKCLNKFNSYKE